MCSQRVAARLGGNGRRARDRGGTVEPPDDESTRGRRRIADGVAGGVQGTHDSLARHPPRPTDRGRGRARRRPPGEAGGADGDRGRLERPRRPYLHDVSTDSGRASESPEIDDGEKIRPPLRLEAHYLLTAFPDSTLEDEASAILDQQEVLGAAMQAFHDNGVIDPENVPPSIGDQQLTITPVDRDDAAVADLWSTFPEVPKQPCATYRVGPVLIDSTQRTAFERVSDRDLRVSWDEDPADDESVGEKRL